LPDPALVERVDALPVTAFDGECFRHLSPGRDPLSGQGARIQGGRWNPSGSFSVLYLGLDRETVIAEFRRMAQRHRLAPNAFLPRTFYRYGVHLANVLDLRHPHAADTVGLTRAALTDNDLTRCQQIGEAAQHLGREGVLAPSAAGNGTVLAVFMDRLGAESVLDPEQAELWEDTTDVQPTSP
jgi:RES domain-containing protein